MNWNATLLWGFAATLFLTGSISAAQALGWTRMNIHFMLGTMFTPRRDRAKIYGFTIHFLNGWGFAILYALFFEALHTATWWLGALFGFGHGLIVLLVFLPMLPGIHPRMASDVAGPDPTPLLEPPGAMALNYGIATPLATLLAHVVYGAILGIFYPV